MTGDFHAENRAKTIFFVVGAQKSGTTWLQRMLSGLPNVWCRGEGHFADALVMPMARIFKEYNQRMHLIEERVYQGSGEGFPAVTQEQFDGFCRHMMVALLQSGAPDDLEAIGDKTPVNASHMPTLTRLFPNAKVIHIVRDGRDVAVSNYCHIQRVLKAQGLQDGKPFKEVANALITKWSNYVLAANEFHKKNPHVEWLQVRYEDMLANPIEIAKRCASFLLASAINTDQLEAAVHGARFESNSMGRARGDEDPDSFMRKGISGDWKNYFDNDTWSRIDARAKGLLEELGYDTGVH